LVRSEIERYEIENRGLVSVRNEIDNRGLVRVRYEIERIEV